MALKRANGEGSVYFDKSIRRWKAVGPWPERLTRSGLTQSEAIRRRDEALSQRGVNLSRVGPKQTCAELFRAWLDTRQHHVRPRTLERDRGLLKHCAAIESLPVGKVGAQHVQQVLNESSRKHKPATTRKLRAVLKQAFDTAIAWGMLRNNPVSGTIRPKGGTRVKALSAAERKALRKAVRGTPDEALFECYVVLGLRRGEALALTWSDVDFDARTIHVHGELQRVGKHLVVGPPKTEAGDRVIAMHDPLYAALRKWRITQRTLQLKAGAHWYNDDDLVFTTRHGTPREPRNVLRKLRQITGDETMTIHQLRHTAASMMLAKRWPITTVARTLGHAKPEITLRIYAHVIRGLDEDTRELLEAIAAD